MGFKGRILLVLEWRSSDCNKLAKDYAILRCKVESSKVLFKYLRPYF
jgi:hypothetical protein